MKLKGLTDEEFLQYKKASMFLIFPYCTFKCDIENGNQICQNWSLSKANIIDINVDALIVRYLKNPITKAIICGGLEPLDSFNELITFIDVLRENYKCEDDIVIYTGYKEDEVEEKIDQLKKYPNIIVKFGRFKPNQQPHRDEILGIDLASENQYALKIS